MTAPVLEDGLDVLLCRGLIDYLATVGLVTWRADASYPATYQAVAAFILSWPSGPDRIATLSPYLVADDPEQAMSTIGVQIRTRWAGSNPRAVLNFSAAIFDVLHGLGPAELPGGVRMSQCLRRSSASMGQDGSQRWSWVDNYYVDVERPSDNRS